MDGELDRPGGLFVDAVFDAQGDVAVGLAGQIDGPRPIDRRRGLARRAVPDELAAAFKIARHHPICKGFAIGRSIFMAPARDWLLGKLDGEAFAANVANNYRRLIEIWLAPQSAAA